MTRTRVAQHQTHDRIRIVGLAAIILTIVVFALPSFASAESSRSYTVGGSEGGHGMSGSVRSTFGGGGGKYESDCSSGGRGAASTQKAGGVDCSSGGGSKGSGNTPSTKFLELQSRADDIFKQLERITGKSASSTPGHSNWKERYCSPDFPKTAKFNEAGYAQYLKTCERWKNGSTTTDVRPPKASSTPIFKLVRPNGKVAHKHRVDGAVMISWRNTTKDKTVDIDLKKGSTTTSIAKDVVGKRHVQGNGGSYSGGLKSSPGAVRGASTAGPSAISMDGHSGEGNGCSRSASGPSFVGGFLNKGGCTGSGNKGPSAPTYSYRWLNAPEGDGYQIVITAKDGDKTFTDESKVFSVKKLPKGMNWYEEDESEVLGASTSAEDEMDAALDQLEDTLIEMTMRLAS